MDTPTGDFKRGAIRVSDADRDQAVAELSEHYQAGRLTLGEFDDRSGRALAAKTGSDLGALFTDLPKGAPVAVAAPAAFPVDDVPAVAGRRRGGGRFTARVIIAAVILATILGNVASGVGQHHFGFGWLVPVVILGCVFLRLSRRRCC
jgi:hypothetical protein